MSRLKPTSVSEMAYEAARRWRMAQRLGCNPETIELYGRMFGTTQEISARVIQARRGRQPKRADGVR